MRPQPGDYPAFYDTYISLSAGTDAKHMLEDSLQQMEDFLRPVPENQADFAYASGKWTVKEVLQHCIDTERIFAYRALCHARGEQQSLPGFEQNDYASNALVKHRTLASLTDELLLVRRTTFLLFKNFSTEDLERTGIVNGNPIKVLCWAFIIDGHWLHHQRVLKEKYSL